MKAWSSAEAKRHFAQLLQGSQETPQVIELRGKPVGVMISYDTYSRHQTLASPKTLADWLADLQQLHAAEGDFEPPRRTDRAHPLGKDWE